MTVGQHGGGGRVADQMVDRTIDQRDEAGHTQVFVEDSGSNARQVGGLRRDRIRGGDGWINPNGGSYGLADSVQRRRARHQSIPTCSTNLGNEDEEKRVGQQTPKEEEGREAASTEPTESKSAGNQKRPLSSGP